MHGFYGFVGRHWLKPTWQSISHKVLEVLLACFGDQTLLKRCEESPQLICKVETIGMEQEPPGSSQPCALLQCKPLLWTGIIHFDQEQSVVCVILLVCRTSCSYFEVVVIRTEFLKNYAHFFFLKQVTIIGF